MAASHPLVTLARRLAPQLPAVADAVALAVDEPARYREQFADRLAARGVTDARPDLAWLALTDALIAARMACEVDGRDEPADVRRALLRLVEPLPSAFAPPEDAAVTTVLAQAAEALAASGRALVRLDLRTDSHVVALLAADAVSEAQGLVRDAGQRIDRFPLADEPAAAARPACGPRWQARLDAVAFPARPTVHDVLWALLRRPRELDAIAEASVDAPPDDRRLVDAVVALHAAPTAVAAAAEADDPLLALRALRYYHFQTAEAARFKLETAARLAERHRFEPTSAEAAAFAECLVMWDEARAREVLALPPALREALAALGRDLYQAVLDGRNRHLRLVNAVYQPLKIAGDALTALLLEARMADAPSQTDAQQALAWIRARLGTPPAGT